MRAPRKVATPGSYQAPDKKKGKKRKDKKRKEDKKKQKKGRPSLTIRRGTSRKEYRYRY